MYMCSTVITLCLGITLNCLESLYTQPGMLVYSRTRPVLRLQGLSLRATSFVSYLALRKVFNTSERVHNPPLHLKFATVCGGRGRALRSFRYLLRGSWAEGGEHPHCR